MAEPILAEEDWDRLQSALSANSVSASKPSSPRTPFLNVIKCGGCGKNLQLNATKKRRKDGSERITSKIRCMSRPGSPACSGYVFTPDTEIIDPVMRLVLAEIGDEPVTRRVYVQGERSAGMRRSRIRPRTGKTAGTTLRPGCRSPSGGGTWTSPPWRRTL
jgi:site-specific DNA recombinase